MSMTAWEQPALVGQAARESRDVVDSWAGQLESVARLASVIAGTEFVPASYRGSDAAVTAAVLFGREIGVGPLTSLQGIYVVKGQVAMRAQLMRALVLARGHTLRIPEWDSVHVVLVGRRAGGTDETTVTWTTEDARRARLGGNPAWSAYPRAMLLARATGELCRAVFADVIGGMTLTVEEAEDVAPAEAAAAPPAAKAIRRKAPPPPPPPPPAPPLPADPATADPARDGAPSAPPPPPLPPPLPDDGTDDTADDDTADDDTADDAPDTSTDDAPDTSTDDAPDTSTDGADPGEPISGGQRGLLFKLLGEAGRVEPRAERVRVVGALAGRDVESLNELTSAEAGRVIDALTLAGQSAHPGELLDQLVARAGDGGPR